jgi:RHS repeat-associated protein
MVVRSKSGVVLAIESCREIWGGDVYRFSEPVFLKGAITRTSSGYDTAISAIMDDSVPDGEKSGNFNLVDNPNLVLSGTKYHHDSFSQSTNAHYYRNTSETSPPGAPWMTSQGYFIQFVYMPSNTAASEIGLEYYYKYQVENGTWYSGWTAMAYWGVEAIYHNWDTRIGDLPIPSSWSMLLVKASDINWNVCTSVRGIRFSHFGGDVYFDQSACTPVSQFASITLTGLSSQQTVEFRKPDGSVVTTATSTTGSVMLDLYSGGLRCFPASGYFLVRNPDNDIEYESPVISGIFPSDVFAYARSASPFYANPSPPDGFGKLALGTMQYLDQSGTKCMEAYLRYGFKEGALWENAFLVNETKTWNGTDWARTSYIYDSYCNVVQTKDACGARLNYSYVQHGTYLNRTWIQVGSDTISTRYEYENGLLKNEYDAKGRRTTYEYDSIGRIVRTIYPSLDGSSVSVSYEYNDTSRVVTFHDENGTARKTYYNEYGRLAREERLSASGTVYSFREYCYDWNDMVYCLLDNDKDLYIEYDYLGRPIEQWNADYTTVRTVYDDRNNTVSIYDEMGARKDMVYDANDRLVQSIQYLGSVRLYTNMTYDDIGNLLTVTDCANLTTTNEYDIMGRLVKTTYPYGSYQEYWYDNCNRMVKKRTESGTILTYSYDVAGRLKSWSTSSQDHSAYFVYDRNGNIVSATRVQPELTIATTRAYDGWDRLWYENTTVDGMVYRIKYGYDNRSNVVSLDIKDGAFKLSYTYDEFNRLKIVRHNLTTPVTIASFSYNEADQVTNIAYKNGIWADITIDPERGWVDRIHVKDSQKTYLYLDYTTRDSAGRITSMTTSEGTRTHVYDAIGRLKYSNFTSPDGYGTFEFSYDWSGNRKTQVWGSSTTTYQYDAWGRISSRGPTPQVTYAYYNSPEPTGKLYAKNDGTYTWTFYYDPNDLLVKVDRGTETVEKYFYDAFGRRIKSIEDTTTEIVIYSGSDPVYSLKGTKTSYHVYANGMHLVRSDGTAYYFYHCDALGSVWLVTKDNKRVAYSTDYLPFGTPWYPSGTEDFGFVDAKKGKISGLVHMGARYYDPEIGRFITPDPVLGSLRTPASFNRFVYCMNDPIDRVDRDGMWSLLKSLTSFAAAVIDPVASFIGDVGEATVTFAVTVAAETWETLQEIKDVGEKFIEDVKDAAADVANTILSAAMAVKEAWDNLDPGLKQWIVNGVAMAVSFIPIVGPILSCVIDGTFVDMWNAIRSGDWATLGMCALAFVPGMKGATKAFKLASHADDISKITKKLEKHLGKAVKEAKLTAKQERAALKNPNLRKAFMGERIDTQFKASVKRDDSLQGVVRVTGRFERGADVYLVSDSKIWWDVTTSSQWADHLNRYGQGGIHLFY